MISANATRAKLQSHAKNYLATTTLCFRRDQKQISIEFKIVEKKL